MESHEDSARFWEKKLEEKENNLDERESAVMSRELELSAKEEELYSEAYQFRRDYRCDHKVMFSCLFLLYMLIFRIVLMEKPRHLDPSVISVEIRATGMGIM